MPEENVSLTRREREILRLVKEGLTTDVQLSEKLFLSPSTVKAHLSNVYRKLGVRNRTEAVILAFRDESLLEDK